MSTPGSLMMGSIDKPFPTTSPYSPLSAGFAVLPRTLRNIMTQLEVSQR